MVLALPIQEVSPRNLLKFIYDVEQYTVLLASINPGFLQIVGIAPLRLSSWILLSLVLLSLIIKKRSAHKKIIITGLGPTTEFLLSGTSQKITAYSSRHTQKDLKLIRTILDNKQANVSLSLNVKV